MSTDTEIQDQDAAASGWWQPHSIRMRLAAWITGWAGVMVAGVLFSIAAGASYIWHDANQQLVFVFPQSSKFDPAAFLDGFEDRDRLRLEQFSNAIHGSPCENAASSEVVLDVDGGRLIASRVFAQAQRGFSDAGIRLCGLQIQDRARSREDGLLAPFTMMVGAVLVFLLFQVIRARVPFVRDAVGQPSVSGLRASATGAVVGGGLFLLITIAATLLSVATDPAVLMTGRPGPALILAAILVAPLVEEIVFRAWLQSFLSRAVGDLVGLLVAAAVFTGLHAFYQPDTLVMVFVVGLALGWLWQRTRSILACFVAHAVLNSASMVGLYLHFS